MRASVLGPIVVMFTLLGPPLAGALPVLVTPAEPDHLAAAVDAYGARDYERAVTEFQAAYAASASADALFGWAQAERMSGDCPSAVRLYRRLLEGALAPAQQAAAQQNLARCERALGTSPTLPGPTPTGAPAAPGTMVTPGVASAATGEAAPTAAGRPARDGRAWYRDTWGGALAGTGVGLLAVAWGFHVSAQGVRAEADDAYAYQDFERLHARADGRDTVAAVSALLGAGLVAGGVVRYVLVRRRAREGARLGATATAHGGVLVLAGEF
ncbi:MAG: hypothetical protein IT370_26050 [Deltaproteobacteria bacterium]|nr:hypothetical protein [Deltaproteobacteria bacterium]